MKISSLIVQSFVYLLISTLLYCNEAQGMAQQPQSTTEAEKYKQILMKRVQIFFSWLESEKVGSRTEDAKSHHHRRYRGVTKIEVAIMYQLLKRLSTPQIINKYDLEYFALGKKCDARERHRQAMTMRNYSVGICDEVTAYKVAHLGFPEASTFIDVGSNKGYTTALMVGLWAGNGYGLTPFKLFQHYERLNMFQTGPSPAGYCKTGLDRAYPLYCPSSPSTKDSRHSRNRHADGRCDRQRLDRSPGPHLSVYAVDGGSKLVRSFRNATLSLPVFNTSVLSRSIHFVHAAMSNREGVATFSVPDDAATSGYEGGKIAGQYSVHNRGHIRDQKRLEVVNMTTLDKFINNSKLFGKVDVVKVDAEGMDLSVIRGGQKSLSSLGIIMWEEWRKSIRKLARILSKLENGHFECFVPFSGGFIKLTSDCSRSTTVDMRRGANIICISRKKAPVAALAFEVLSSIHPKVF